MANKKAKDTTQQVDEGALVPLLKKMDGTKCLDSLKQQANHFLDQCRFAGDKITAAKRDLNEMTDAKRIQLFCWNVLLSGQGQAVLKW